MREVYEALRQIITKGETEALATVMGTTGSTPRNAGDLRMVCGGTKRVFIEPIGPDLVGYGNSS